MEDSYNHPPQFALPLTPEPKGRGTPTRPIPPRRGGENEYKNKNGERNNCMIPSMFNPTHSVTRPNLKTGDI